MLKVGLTGGIATGKSHAVSIFRALGCHIIDADQIARDVVTPCQPAYHDIVREFGPDILHEDGDINRARLGTFIFSHPDERRRLNAIVHPRVIEEIGERLAAHEASDPTGIIVVDGALIIEVGVQSLFDALIVVHCNPEEQLKRLMRRDGLTRQQALSRIQAQMPSEEKRTYADYEIDTSGTFQETRAQVERIYRALQTHARPSPSMALDRADSPV